MITLKDKIKKGLKEFEITDELVNDVLKDYEKEIEDTEPYYRYDSFDIEKVKTIAYSEGFRKNTQKLADSLRVVAWIEKKLHRLGKMQSRIVEYDLERFGFEGKGKMLVFDQCVTLYTSAIAEDLGISFSRAKKAKELLSEIGLIGFLKTIKTANGRFLKLWVVDLEYYGNVINESNFDICDISDEEAERDRDLIEENAAQLALLDDFIGSGFDSVDDFIKDFNSRRSSGNNSFADINSNDSFADISISINNNGDIKMGRLK